MRARVMKKVHAPASATGGTGHKMSGVELYGQLPAAGDVALRPGAPLVRTNARPVRTIKQERATRGATNNNDTRTSTIARVPPRPEPLRQLFMFVLGNAQRVLPIVVVLVASYVLGMYLKYWRPCVALHTSAEYAAQVRCPRLSVWGTAWLVWGCARACSEEGFFWRRFLPHSRLSAVFKMPGVFIVPCTQGGEVISADPIIHVSESTKFVCLHVRKNNPPCAPIGIETP